MIAAILGTLKAGAAYVPLDPGHARGAAADRPGRHAAAPAAHPARRSCNRLSDCETTVICIDDRSSILEGTTARDRGRRRVACSCGDLAYVIYTSGSTGRPKGVMVEHRAIGNTDPVARSGPDGPPPATVVLQQSALHVRPVALHRSSPRWQSAPGWSWPPPARSTTRTGCWSACTAGRRDDPGGAACPCSG